MTALRQRLETEVTEFDEQFLYDEYIDVIVYNETIKYLNDNNIRPFTNVIADEFQDFSNPELKFLRALVAEGRNDLFLTGDPMQRIYSGRKINFGAAGINVRGVRSRRLKISLALENPAV